MAEQELTPAEKHEMAKKNCNHKGTGSTGIKYEEMRCAFCYRYLDD